MLPLSPLDWIAAGIFAAAWFGYAIVFDWWPTRRPVTLNRAMALVRVNWMRQMLVRDARIMDSMLLGHLINSVSFFASATVLLLAGLIGTLASGEAAREMVAGLGLAADAPPALFEAKVLLLIGIFVYAFFKFTWAIRQFNYTVAFIGAAPPIPLSAQRVSRLATDAAALMSQAVGAFNTGIRAYYFAFAALGWLLHPWVLIGLSVLVLAVLSFRQLGSPAFRLVTHYAKDSADGPS